MCKNITEENTKLIAIYDGVLYEYHDGSWLEKESWRTDEELFYVQLFKEIVESKEERLMSLSRIASAKDALRQRMISILGSD